jgi:hypothetical protein
MEAELSTSAAPVSNSNKFSDNLSPSLNRDVLDSPDLLGKLKEELLLAEDALEPQLATTLRPIL